MRVILVVAVLVICLVAAVSAGETFVTPVNTPGTATLSFDTIDCSNNTPVINLNGQLKMSGLNAVFIFRNNVKGTHTKIISRQVTVQILQKGETITFQKQPSLDGVGGNPLIYVGFTDGDGNTIVAPVLIGRCVQLSK